MLAWNYIVILLCLLLLAFAWRNEWQRMNKSRLMWRMAASFVVIACFACFALPLTKTIKATAAPGKQAVLLTEGFNKDSVSSFLTANSNIPVYAIDRNIITSTKNYKTQFLSVADLASLKTTVSGIHIFGYGLDKYELQVMPSSIMIFHPAKAADGISSINWKHKIKIGETLKVQGNFSNASAKDIKLIFSGYGVNMDTAIIHANRNENFELSVVPKQLGKAIYHLTALAGTDTLENEPVPFESEQPGNLKILILAASPDFENKFLKSWLSRNEYLLVTRTRISKDKYEKTFLNTPEVSFNTITSSFLNDFNLVIADASELGAISKSELAAIESQVSQKGMGLIVKGDSASARNSFYTKNFPVITDSANNKKDFSVYIPVSNEYATVATTEHPAYIRPHGGTKSLIEDKQSNILVSSAVYGTGKLVYTTLNSTYTWMLSGNNEVYQTFWSYLLDKVTAKTNIDRSWNISPAYPYVNKAVEINYNSDNTETPQVQVGQDFVHLVQNPDLTFQWQGTYWPQRSGWQALMQQGKATSWWYAYDTNNWKTITASQKIKATLQSIDTKIGNNSKDAAQDTLVTVPLSKKYFFIVFLLCAGFLWIEKKL